MTTPDRRTRRALLAALAVATLLSGGIAVASSGAREPLRSNRPGASGTTRIVNAPTAAARSNRPGATGTQGSTAITGTRSNRPAVQEVTP